MQASGEPSPRAPVAGWEPLRLEPRDGLLWIIFDLPGEKVNKLSSRFMALLDGTLAELAGRSDVEGVVFCSAKEGIFLAGADIHEIRAIEDRDEARRAALVGQQIFRRIETLPFPAVAAINGVCLGGGTELALACRGRLGTDHPRFQIGLPEVNLGIIPAWGGTTRLPRQVGLSAGLELILTGRPMDAKKAERIGLIDAAVPHQEVDRHAAELVRRLAREGRRRSGRPFWALDGNRLGRELILREAHKKVMKRTRGHYPAPLAVLDVVRRGWDMPLENSLALEAEKLAELLTGSVAKHLVHVYFLTEKAKKDPGVEGEAPPPKPIARAGLLGAGTMGGGIAWLLSHRDIPVRVKDVSPEALGVGLATARRGHEERRTRKRLTSWELERKMALVQPTLDWSGFGEADVVFEAIVEDLAIKKKVLAELEDQIGAECLIGSNTSTLPISELQGALRRPERMAGFHFFNPVDRMPLVEVIRGGATADATVASLVALAKRLGKTPVVVADGPGFLVNRILGPYLNEACHLLVETGDLEGIDRALRDFGMPMGPLRLLDEVGIDVAAKAGKVLADAYGPRSSPPGVVEKLVEAGRLGKKSGRGLYRHQGKKAWPDPEAISLLGISSRRSVGSEEAIERTIFPMVSEAARCLAENVVRGAGDLDLALVMGIGFPPFRGGLLRYAEEVGIGAIVESLRRWQQRLGARFEPAPALVERSAGRGFYS